MDKQNFSFETDDGGTLTAEGWRKWVSHVLAQHEDKIQALDDETDDKFSRIETDVHNLYAEKTPLHEDRHIGYIFFGLVIALMVSNHYDVNPLTALTVLFGISYFFTVLNHFKKRT